MFEFGWFAGRRELPERWDLRRAGWCLIESGRQGHSRSPYPLLVEAGLERDRPPDIIGKEWVVILGVDAGDERARLIGAGFGDALPVNVDLPELSARTRRVAISACKLPRRRQIGRVTLDLCHRDVIVDERWTGLHPREFELLWRLTESRGALVTRKRLLKDVWRLEHDPETNNVEVHISRLRSKLAVMGVAGLVTTDPGGGYRVNFRFDEIHASERDAGPLDAYTC